MKQQETGDSEFLPALMLGLAIGVPLGLLLAPGPGKQTLAKVLDFTDEMSDRVASVVEDVEDILRVGMLKARGYGNRG